MTFHVKDDSLKQSETSYSAEIDIRHGKGIGRGLDVENSRIYEDLRTYKSANVPRMYTPPFKVGSGHSYQYKGSNAICIDANWTDVYNGPSIVTLEACAEGTEGPWYEVARIDGEYLQPATSPGTSTVIQKINYVNKIFGSGTGTGGFSKSGSISNLDIVGYLHINKGSSFRIPNKVNIDRATHIELNVIHGNGINGGLGKSGSFTEPLQFTIGNFSNNTSYYNATLTDIVSAGSNRKSSNIESVWGSTVPYVWTKYTLDLRTDGSGNWGQTNRGMVDIQFNQWLQSISAGEDIGIAGIKFISQTTNTAIPSSSRKIWFLFDSNGYYSGYEEENTFAKPYVSGSDANLAQGKVWYRLSADSSVNTTNTNDVIKSVTPNRAVSTISRPYGDSAGGWWEPIEVYAKHNNSWKEVKEVYAKINNVWEKVFPKFVNSEDNVTITNISKSTSVKYVSLPKPNTVDNLTYKSVTAIPKKWTVVGTTNNPKSNTQIEEGKYTATFTVNTSGIPNGTTFIWRTYGSHKPTDLVLGSGTGSPTTLSSGGYSYQGTGTITSTDYGISGTATISFGAVADSLTEGDKTLFLEIYDANSKKLGISNALTIKDTSLTPEPKAASHVCISFINETNAYVKDDWNKFKNSYPNRDLILGGVNGGFSAWSKSSWINHLNSLNNYKESNNGYFYRVESDNVPQDWFFILGMKKYAPGTVVNIVVDNSGSMTTSVISKNLKRFIDSCIAAGLKVTNNSWSTMKGENWIIDHITDLATPVYKPAPAPQPLYKLGLNRIWYNNNIRDDYTKLIPSNRLTNYLPKAGLTGLPKSSATALRSSSYNDGTTYRTQHYDIWNHTSGYPSTLYAVEIRGYLIALQSGIHKFRIDSDDGMYFWIGNHAMNGVNGTGTKQNTFIKEPNLHPTKVTYGSIYLSMGVYYPVWGYVYNNYGPCVFDLHIDKYVQFYHLGDGWK